MQQDATDGLSNLDRAFGAAMEHNRALMENTAGFLREESFRFINQRIERTRDAMEQLSECRGMPALLQVQREWLGNLIQDCAAQNQRAQELWSQGAQRLRAEMEHQAEAARETATSTAQAGADAARDAGHHAAEAAHETMAPEHEAAPTYNELH